MPFQSDKQRRYMHANLPELAQRWEQEYSNGGIARIPFAYGPIKEDVGEKMINIGTASGNALDNQLAEVFQKDIDASKMSGFKNQDYESYKNQMELLGGTKVTPFEFKRLQEGTITEPGTYKKASLTNDQYLDQNNLYASANNVGSDANIVDDVDAGIAGLSTDVFEPPAYETFSPNYTEGTDFGNTNFFGEPVIDEVVSRSFKDHDNLKSWLDANPDMGENIKRKAIDFYEGAKDVGRWGIDKTTAFKDMLLSGAGQLIDFPLAALGKVAGFRNPLNPKSANYNRNLKGQVDYLGNRGMLSGSSGSSGPYKITSGALRGKNLVSGFGTNDYNKMLQKRIDYFNKFKEKRGLTIAQNKKLQDAIAEKKAADAAAAAANRRKVEQYTGRPMSDYRSSRPASERQFTGHGKSGMGRSADRFA